MSGQKIRRHLRWRDRRFDRRPRPVAREGHQVTLLERNAEGSDSCVLGSAGYVSPSHMVPLAAPGMVAFALRRMGDSRSPFFMKPRLDPAFLRWGWLFWRAATHRRVERAAPVLRDLALASRTWFEGFAVETDNPFGLEAHGLFSLCRTHEGMEHLVEEAQFLREHGLEAEVLSAEETARRQPGTKLSILGSVFFPIDAHLYPPRLVESLVGALKKLGVDLKWNTEIHAVGGRPADGRHGGANLGG